MSVYVGIDVHRQRSQVAVVAEDGKVQLNRNVVNGQEALLHCPVMRVAGSSTQDGHMRQARMSTQASQHRGAPRWHDPRIRCTHSQASMLLATPVFSLAA
jgi:hypothetical protein